MFKRCSLIVIVILLASCVHRAPKMQPAPVHAPVMKTTQTRALTSFNQVDVQGQININLHTGYKKPHIILRGDPRDLQQVQASVRSNRLYVSIGKGYPQFGPLTADLRTAQLNRIHYVGSGIISGNQLNTTNLNVIIANQGTTRLGGTIGLYLLDLTGGLTQISGINSPNLQVHLRDNAKVQLTGVANLSALNIDGAGWLSMYWVRSNNLRVRAKNAAKIQLAGIVNRLDVALWGTSQFKGRYLRAKRSFVKTHGKSVAEISSLNHQSTLSTDASDVYYFNLPNTRADFMAENGSVLDMREWDQFNPKDFTRYNKQFP